jgi:hypothetical protein
MAEAGAILRHADLSVLRAPLLAGSNFIRARPPLWQAQTCCAPRRRSSKPWRGSGAITASPRSSAACRGGRLSCPGPVRHCSERQRSVQGGPRSVRNRAGTYRGAPEQDRQSPHGLHIVHKPSAYAPVLLIQNVLSRTSFGIPRPGCLRPRVRKVAAMRHRRDVLDVLSLIDQSTVDLSVFEASVNVAADPNGAA